MQWKYLDHSGEVSQIELVMTLRRCWQQITQALLINVQRCEDNLVNARIKIFTETPTNGT